MWVGHRWCARLAAARERAVADPHAAGSECGWRTAPQVSGGLTAGVAAAGATPGVRR